MGEPKLAVIFDLPKAVEIQLADKTFKLRVSEEEGSDFCLHQLGVKDVDVSLRGIP